MKIETNNYSQPSFNATLQLKGNTKLLKENQDLILKVFAKRFGSYSDIIELNLPKKFIENKGKLGVTTHVNDIIEKFTAVVDKNMFISSILNTQDKLNEIFTRNAEKPAPTKVKTKAEKEAEKRAEEEAKKRAEEEAKIKAEKEKIITDKLNEFLDFTKNIKDLTPEQSQILMRSLNNLLEEPDIRHKIVNNIGEMIICNEKNMKVIAENVYSKIMSDEHKLMGLGGRIGYLCAFESNPITYHARHSRR